MRDSTGPRRRRERHSDATLYILYKESLRIYTGWCQKLRITLLSRANGTGADSVGGDAVLGVLERDRAC
jgi:hypothetical protein